MSPPPAYITHQSYIFLTVNELQIGSTYLFLATFYLVLKYQSILCLTQHIIQNYRVCVRQHHTPRYSLKLFMRCLIACALYKQTTLALQYTHTLMSAVMLIYTNRCLQAHFPTFLIALDSVCSFTTLTILCGGSMKPDRLLD